MDIFDINFMMGPWPVKHRFFETVEEIIGQLELHRFYGCLAYHSVAMWDTFRGNLLVKEAEDGSKGFIKSCYVLSPNLGSSEMPDKENLLKHLREDRPAAVKLCPEKKGFIFDGFYCSELLEVLNELAMPLLIEADQLQVFQALPELCRTYSSVKFILLGRGFKESRHIVPLIRKRDNVFFETSRMVDTGLIEEIVRKYGSEKLLFGSGMPFSVPGGALGLIFYSRIRDNDREKILGGNWKTVEGGILWQ